MLREKIQQYRARTRALATHPGLWLGKAATVSDSRFEAQNRIGDHAHVAHSSLGRYSYVGPRCIVSHADIGRFCAVAPDAIIGTGGHPIGANASIHPLFYLHRPAIGWDFVERDQASEYARTRIGHDVWIGAKAVVRDGVTIGNGAVVGAGAVVVHDLAPYGIYVGVPARLLRFRYAEDIVAQLEAHGWWDRDPAWLLANAAAFADVGSLLARLATDPHQS
ncbi:DapH/DapD/GlmU-related protein [Sphingomonas sp. KR1UV-12]|uniref:DapH/DapD/GlmU-related protein n=1 Tax=Sphingomonas aurea TaxID=3063994 RepID=A0ABT9EQ69_9SPHN|nr:DapH/DapD/GlmU-related protein [Sphingomonas sp. KR1UV-12]MDP1028793.1 DapH/DapD/GlmU-related protein [Sphingomonas sp. KR1UV-12]